MNGPADAALLAAVAIGSVLGASALAQASWPRRSPAAAILLWQSLGLAAGLAAVGTLVSLLPAMLLLVRMACLAAGLALLASLCWVLIAAAAAARQARRRQRALLA